MQAAPPLPHHLKENGYTYNGAMSVGTTTKSLRPPKSSRPRLSAHAKIVLRGRYLAKNSAGTIVETPAKLFWRVTTDIAQAERPLDGHH
jgi:ribonucleotide reductase alpha subunit